MLLTMSSVLATRVLSAGITWQDLPPLPVGVAGGAVGVMEDARLLYAGGTTWINGAKQWLREVRQYDLAAGSWGQGPPLPEPLAYGGWAATSDALEVFGGMNGSGPSRNCWRLDSGLRRWTKTHWAKTGELPRNAVLARVEQVDRAVYLFGGCSDVAAPMHCSHDVWSRDVPGKWSLIGEMPDGAVAMRAGAVLDRRIYLFGGCSEDSAGVVNRDGAYCFDPSTRDWRKLRPVPVPVRGLSAANIGGGRILLAGGYAASFSNQAWIYDTAKDRYEGAAPLPFAVSGIEVVVHEGAIFALGGEDRMRGRSRRCIQGKLK